MLDREARAELGISGEEFLRRLDAGEYDCCEHSDLRSTAWLLRGHRATQLNHIMDEELPRYAEVFERLAEWD